MRALIIERLMRSVRYATAASCGLAAAACLGGLATSIGGAAAATVDGPKLSWKVATYGNRRASTEAYHLLSDSVAEATGENFKIEVVYNVLSDVRTILDGTKIGAFESGMVIGSYHPARMPSLNVWSLPFLPLGDLKVQARVAFDYYKLPEAIKDATAWNVLINMPMIQPPAELMGRGKPPYNINDMKGTRVRAVGGLGKAFAKIGAVPTTVSSSELLMALERGMVDSVATPIYVLLSDRTYEASNWYTTNLQLGTVTAFSAVNLDAFNGLPPQYKKLIVEGSVTAVDRQRKIFDEETKRGIEAFKAKNLVEVTYSAAARNDFINSAARPVWDEWVEEVTKAGYDGKKLLDFVLTEAAKGSI